MHYNRGVLGDVGHDLLSITGHRYHNVRSVWVGILTLIYCFYFVTI